MAGNVPNRAATLIADQPISRLDGVLAELATEQAGMAESLQSLTSFAAGALDESAGPALMLAEETLAHARASVLIASYLVRMVDGYRRRSGSEPDERLADEPLPVGGDWSLPS